MSVTASPAIHAVACTGVTKAFGSGDTRVQVLRGIDVEVAPGEITLLVGPSGCGKTTLISIVAGLLAPTTGDVRIFDRRLGDLRGDALVAFRARTIGFVFQQYNLLPALTAAENACLPLIVQGRRRSRS